MFLNVLLGRNGPAMSYDTNSNRPMVSIGCRGLFTYCLMSNWLHALQLRTQLTTSLCASGQKNFDVKFFHVLVLAKWRAAGWSCTACITRCQNRAGRTIFFFQVRIPLASTARNFRSRFIGPIFSTSKYPWIPDTGVIAWLIRLQLELSGSRPY